MFQFTFAIGCIKAPPLPQRCFCVSPVCCWSLAQIFLNCVGNLSMREMFTYVVHWPTLIHEVDSTNSFICLRAFLGFSVIAERISRNVALFVLPVALTLNLLTITIVAPPSNASKWQMGFNSAFKGLKSACQLLLPSSCLVFSRYTP